MEIVSKFCNKNLASNKRATGADCSSHFCLSSGSFWITIYSALYSHDKHYAGYLIKRNALGQEHVHHVGITQCCGIWGTQKVCESNFEFLEFYLSLSYLSISFCCCRAYSSQTVTDFSIWVLKPGGLLAPCCHYNHPRYPSVVGT